MKKIELIDSNFEVKTKLDEKDIRFYGIRQSPFKIYGVFYESGKFRRLPEAVAKSVNDGVYTLHAHTAGGRVRFKTDSPYIAIHAVMSGICKMPHFAFTGSAGFDLYIRKDAERYAATFIPPFDIQDGYESIVRFDSAEMCEVTVNFPLYSEVCELYIGLKEGSFLGEAEDYKTQKPIVFYGSSITQGGCASRPGTSYESLVSRRLDADYINLGFSGSARGEDEIAEYISALDMSVFVYDYDHNAPTAEHLKNTHEKMFRKIRQAHPELPIVMLSRPKYFLSEEEEKRLGIIKETYENAVADGDKNVYLIDGRDLMKLAGDEGLVDGSHPNDLGFMSMAETLCEVLKEILQ